MSIITSEAHFRQRVLRYSLKYGVTKASNRFGRSRQVVYEWRAKWDGKSWKSLVEKSHRPHHHPNAHTSEELKLIADMRKCNMESGLVVFWVKLRQRGYTRSITGLYRVLRRQGQMAVKPPNPKYIPKPYEQMQYPGQRVQIDVKFVPEACIVGDAKGQKFYQYTAIDEYSRFRYLEAFDEHSTYTSTIFLEYMLKKFPFKVECVQTDNGLEFTKRLANTHTPTLTMFERKLAELGIRHKYIKPYTLRHNGKVERSHRKDSEEFYATHTFYSFEDFAKQLKVRNYTYNKFPIRPLNWKSPDECIHVFLETGEIF